MDKATHNGMQGCLSDKHFLKPPSVAHSSRKGVLPILPPLTTIRFLGWQGSAPIPTATCTFLPFTTTEGTAWNAIQVETRIPMRPMELAPSGFCGLERSSSEKLPIFMDSPLSHLIKLPSPLHTTFCALLCSPFFLPSPFFFSQEFFSVSSSQVPF